MGGHARSTYYSEDGNGKVLKFERGKTSVVVEDQLEIAALQAGSRAFYTHIFGQQKAGDLPSEAALTALATAMKARPYAPKTVSNIPAGYTYLGQFIFHDITFLDPDNIKINKRTPALDLDSVLPLDLNGGFTPEQGCHGSSPLPVGCTSGDSNGPYDLPRDPYDGSNPGRPNIRDERNDDFLPLAQVHLILLKFFNVIAKHDGYNPTTGAPPKNGWKNVRKTWVQYFQYVVLHDFLCRLVDRDTHQSVMCGGRCIVKPKGHIPGEAWMPIEFTGAVARFGHSMIRDNYAPWNSKIADREVSVTQFMNFSYLNSGNHLDSEQYRLRHDWVPNWQMLFDFAGTAYASKAGPPLMAGLIGGYLVEEVHNLPPCLLEIECTVDGRNDPHKVSVAEISLARGRELGLASAQLAICKASEKVGGNIPSVGLSELADDQMTQDVFEKYNLYDCTPLWYYCLKEAEHLGCGVKLGPLGGRILMETVHAAIESSEDSILANPGWKPLLGTTAGRFEMADLIAACGDNPNPWE